MADLAGYLMSIQDQNCKILKRVAKIEKHLFIQAKEDTKDSKIDNSIIKVNETRKLSKLNTQTKRKVNQSKNLNFKIKKTDEDFKSKKLED